MQHLAGDCPLACSGDLLTNQRSVALWRRAARLREIYFSKLTPYYIFDSNPGLCDGKVYFTELQWNWPTTNGTIWRRIIMKKSTFTETIERVSELGGTLLVTSQEMAAFDVPLPPSLWSCNENDGGTSAARHSPWSHIEPDWYCGKTRLRLTGLTNNLEVSQQPRQSEKGATFKSHLNALRVRGPKSFSKPRSHQDSLHVSKRKHKSPSLRTPCAMQKAEDCFLQQEVT